jgi:hypothetical protein
VQVTGKLPTVIAFGDRRRVIHPAALYDLNTGVRQTISLFEKFV